MRIKQLLIGVTLMAALASAPFSLTGCKTNQQMAPGGVYENKADLYNIDNTITTSYDIIHQLVTWEFVNRQALPKEVTQAADAIRDKAETAFTAALHARDSYAKSGTAQDRNALDTALALLRSLTTDAANYMAAHKTSNQ